MYYREQRRRKKRWLWLLAGIVPITASIIFAVIQSSKSPPLATPTPELSKFDGRLILMGLSYVSPSEYKAEFFSLSGDSTAPIPIWENLSGKIIFSASPTYLGGEKLISPDGKLIALCAEEGIAVVDLSNGELIYLNQDQINCNQGAFSPDNRYLVFGSEEDLWLLDLSRQSEPVKLYTAPSAVYGDQGTIRAHGSVYQPLWLDERTLLYSSYEGAMPEKIETILSAPTTLPPNSTTWVEVEDGKAVSSRAIYISTYTFQHSGMISFAGGVLAGDAWLDRDALKSGQFESYQPFPEDSEWSTQMPTYVSPDGRYAVFMERPSAFVFHLVDTGSAAEIGSTTYYTDHTLDRHHCLDASWSPDMQSLACRSLDDGLFILSFTRGNTIAGLVDLSRFDEWLLLTWLP